MEKSRHQPLKRFGFTDSPQTNSPSRRSCRFPRDTEPHNSWNLMQVKRQTHQTYNTTNYLRFPILCMGGRLNNAHSSEQTMMPLCRHMAQRKHRLSCILNSAYNPQRRLTPNSEFRFIGDLQITSPKHTQAKLQTK
jgi:hypothetical protein